VAIAPVWLSVPRHTTGTGGRKTDEVQSLLGIQRRLVTLQLTDGLEMCTASIIREVIHRHDDGGSKHL
jgi:hypothetical protein